MRTGGRRRDGVLKHHSGLIRGRADRIALRAPRLLQDATRPTLRDLQRGLHVADRLAPVRRAQKFPEATSFRMALGAAWPQLPRSAANQRPRFAFGSPP